MAAWFGSLTVQCRARLQRMQLHSHLSALYGNLSVMTVMPMFIWMYVITAAMLHDLPKMNLCMFVCVCA